MADSNGQKSQFALKHLMQDVEQNTPIAWRRPVLSLLLAVGSLLSPVSQAAAQASAPAPETPSLKAAQAISALMGFRAETPHRHSKGNIVYPDEQVRFENRNFLADKTDYAAAAHSLARSTDSQSIRPHDWGQMVEALQKRSSPLENLRDITKWTAKAIKYDTDEADGSNRNDTGIITLDRGEGVCGDYAHLIARTAVASRTVPPEAVSLLYANVEFLDKPRNDPDRNAEHMVAKFEVNRIPYIADGAAGTGFFGTADEYRKWASEKAHARITPLASLSFDGKTVRVYAPSPAGAPGQGAANALSGSAPDSDPASKLVSSEIDRLAQEAARQPRSGYIRKDSNTSEMTGDKF